MAYKYILTCVIIMSVQVQADYKDVVSRIPEDGRLNFTALSWKYGHAAEEYDIITQDGYILKLNHMIGDKTRPVLLLHGALSSSEGFLLRGHTSLAVTLAREGYDVWALNIRGNRHSRRHIYLNADRHKEFWDFSLHEISYYDIPVTIDFILKSTTQKKLRIVGYSEGTILTYIMGAIRPEYNDKISILVSLAPIYFLRNTKPLMSILIEFSTEINAFFVNAGMLEIGGFESVTKRVVEDICGIKGIGYRLCLINIIYLVIGPDIDEIEEDFFPVLIGQFPAGSSIKSVNHMLNFGKRQNIGQYDYGPLKNEIVYGSKTPPNYDLSKVTMKVALYLGKNDRISTIKDTELLRKQLPNVVKYHVVDRPQFNHFDFLWGRNTYKILFPHVLDTLSRYG